MARYSQKRGGQSGFRKISHYKISIICDVDVENHIIMNITEWESE